MDKNSAGDLLMRIQRMISKWGWSLAIGAVLEVHDEHDGFVMTGNVQEIATVVRDEMRYRCKVQGTGGA